MTKENRKKDLVLVYGIMIAGLLASMTGIVNAKTVNVDIWGAGKFEPESLMINVGDTIIWQNDGNARTLISDEGLFENRNIDAYKTTSYTFDIPGRYIIRTPCLNCGGGNGPGYTQTIAVNEVPVMKILSWNNDLTSGKQENLEIPAGKTIRFDITTNYDIDSILDFHIPYSSINKIDTKNVYMDVQFPSVGIFDIKMGVANSKYGSDSKTWTIAVVTMTTPTPTMTTSTPTMTTPTPTTRRAKLKASYEIGSNNNRIEISVKIENIGDATASFIEAVINNPTELDPKIIFGGEQTGSIITWSGDLVPGETHETKYSTAVVKDKDIRVPIDIKYTKMSGAEKAQILGMAVPSNMESAKALMTDDDWEKLDLVIVILKSLSKLPGFEILFGIATIFLIYIIRRNL